MSSSVSLEYLNTRLGGLTVTSPTTTALSAQNSNGTSIVVILLGAPVPLPTRPYNNGFTANTANTIFTVQNTGTYFIQYFVGTTLSLLLSSSVYKNGVAIPNLICSPGIAGTNFTGTAIVPLNANDTLQLTLYGLVDTAILRSGVGANMNIIRIA